MDVSVNYEKFPVLSNITAEIPSGSTTVILGPSGCGKSTLLKTAAGLVLPSFGTVELLGNDLARIGERELRELRLRNSFVFQDAALWQNMTVWQNMALPIEYHNPSVTVAELRQVIEPILEELGFEGQRDLRPSQLSAGERKIISFARALVSDPTLIFVDEPTTFVDSDVSERMLGMMRRLKAMKKSLVLVTHNPDLTAQLADYILVLKRGKLLMAGTVGDVVRTTRPDVRAILADVLSEAATYDTDILTLLDRERDGFGDE